MQSRFRREHGAEESNLSDDGGFEQRAQRRMVGERVSDGEGRDVLQKRPKAFRNQAALVHS